MSHVNLDSDALLRHAPTTTVSFRLPLPLSVRLDQLVASARESGERTDRRELLAALLLDAAPSAEEMARLLRRVRQASNADAVRASVDAPSGTLTLPAPRPGPRRAT